MKKQSTRQRVGIWCRGVGNRIARKEWLLAIVMTVVLVAVGVFLGTANNKVVPVNQDPGAHYAQEPGNHLSFMANWDGPDYLRIAGGGYSSASLTNFFPLYPLVIRLVNQIVGSLLYSSLIVSWVCLVGAIYFYLKLAKRLFKLDDNLEGLRAVAFFVLFPTAVFLLASYSESLLAFASLGGIYFALQKRFVYAGLFGIVATATHITGSFALLLMALLLWEEGAGLVKAALTFIIGSLGIVGYMAFLWTKFHNPLEFIAAQQKHGWLQYSGATPLGIGWLNVIFIALLLVAAIYWLPRRKSFSVYSLLFLAIPLVGGQFGGFNRYVLMAFPLQLMFYEYLRDRKIGYSFCLCLSAILWAYFLFQYAGGYVGG